MSGSKKVPGRPDWRLVQAALNRTPELKFEKQVEREVMREVLTEQLTKGEPIGEIGAFNYPSNHLGSARYCGHSPSVSSYGLTQREQAERQTKAEILAEVETLAERKGSAQFWRTMFKTKPGRHIPVTLSRT